LKLWMSEPYGVVDLSSSSINPRAEATISRVSTG
jgi:hypothetical protein